MKFLLLASLVLTSGLIQADQGAMEKARVLFPEFSKSVYSDESKARGIFDELLALGPAVQQRLLVWLDEEFEGNKNAYQKAKNPSSTGIRSSSPGDARKISELQQKLELIRNIKGEDEMKKTLKDTGWPTLKDLLRLKRSTIRSINEPTLTPPDPEKARAILKEAKKIGQFRYDLRMKLKKQVMDVEAELKRSESDDQEARLAETIEANGRAASVLAKNDKLKGEIVRQEYEGILELNHWRIAAGMDPLLIDPKLCDAARDHCKDMESLNFFAHDSPVKGKTKPWDRAKNFGTTARGENIAINNSPSASNQAWFFSPGHHKNMFNPDFSVIGLGIQGRHYCQLFR